MRTSLFLIVLLFLTANLYGQDTSSILLDNIDINGQKLGFKKVGLYDESPEEDYNIRGFTQLLLFENDLTDEFWMSEDTRCVSSQLKGKGEEYYLNLRWNKDLDGCDWVGLGFGWDGWSGKDLGYVVDTLAIELIVRSTGKPFTNIPWAFGIEDYSSQQAWLGYNKSFLQSENISTDWTKVEIPLSLFPFEENDVDLTNVKQLLIQVFAEGAIEIKKVHLIPFSKKLKKEVVAVQLGKTTSAEGFFKAKNTFYSAIDGGHSFAVAYTTDSLYFSFLIKDETPRINNQNDGNLWQGDAIEIAFSTNVAANKKRKYLLLSDQHIGLNAGSSPYVWDWKESKKEESIRHEFGTWAEGYTVDISVPFSALYHRQLTAGMLLDFEIAIDLNEGDTRKTQNRWNSIFEEGFNTSPTKWGTILFK